MFVLMGCDAYAMLDEDAYECFMRLRACLTPRVLQRVTWEGAVKSKPPSPSFGKEMAAMLCPLVEVEQGAALSPCQPLGSSLKLHGTIP